MLYVLLYTVISGFLALIITVVAGKPQRSVGALGIAASLTFLILVLGRWLFQPLFTHLLTGGHAWYMITAVSTAVFAVIMLSYEKSNSRYGEDEMDPTMFGWGIGVFALFFFVFGVLNAFLPPAFCSEEGHRELANIWQLEKSEEALHAQEVDPELKVQVSPEMALLRARNAMPGDLGSYLEVAGNPALQILNGHPYYVVGIRVRSGQWSAFTRNGTVIPGYFIVDALQKDAAAKLVTGHEMKIVDADRFMFEYELDRYAYYNFFASRGYRFSDLTSIELDEAGKPYYTATLLQHKIGHTGDIVAGTMILDPETGESQEYPAKEMPSWLDDIWTKEIFTQYATWWGEYAFGTVCNPWNQSGKRKIDNMTDVFTSDGRLWYQITMTSLGSDTSLTDVIYANPTSGKVFRYDVSGKGFPTISYVDETVMEQATQRINPKGFEAVEVELDWINGEWVYYGILLGRDNNGNTSGAFNGYAFLRATDAAEGDINAVVIADDISDALRLLSTQGEARRSDISSTSERQQFRGVVERVYALDYGDGVVVRMLIATTTLTSSITSTMTIALQMGALDQDGVASHLMKGDNVIVTASKGEVDIWWSVQEMVIQGDPVFGRKEN